MKPIYVFMLILAFSSFIRSQSNVNPDISAIGSFNTSTDFTKGSEDYGKLIFEQPSLELFVEGYLNPYSKAAVDVAYEEGSFKVEELYASVLQGLPLDLQLKAGKYLVGLGKLNTVHPHAWPFINRPLFHRVYFGEEGFNDVGINVNFILPTESFFSSIELGIYKGDAIGKTEAADPERQESINSLRGSSPVFAGRFNAFFDLDDYNNIETGISASYGIHANSNYYYSLPGRSLNHQNKALDYTYLIFDFKYKYRPDSYTALTIQGEGLYNHRKVMNLFVDEDINSYSINLINTGGAFLYIDYLFDKQYSAGLKYDFTYGIPGDTPGELSLANDSRSKTYGIEGWFGFYPVEETLGVRLGVQHIIYDYADKSRSNDTKATLQLIFSLGPHKAHPF